MLAGAAAKRFVVVIGVVLVALLLVGLVRGAIGSAILGAESLVPQPEIHLPPQPVFPASSGKSIWALPRRATTLLKPRGAALRPLMVTVPKRVPLKLRGRKNTTRHRWG